MQTNNNNNIIILQSADGSCYIIPSVPFIVCQSKIEDFYSLRFVFSFSCFRIEKTAWYTWPADNNFTILLHLLCLRVNCSTSHQVFDGLWIRILWLYGVHGLMISWPFYFEHTKLNPFRYRINKIAAISFRLSEKHLLHGQWLEMARKSENRAGERERIRQNK